MKKLILLAALICASHALQAQVYIGGSASVWRTEANIEQTSFRILPEVGYAFNDRWNAGVVLGYADNTALGDYIQITPYVDYTFYRRDIVSMFLEAGASTMVTPGLAGNITFEAGFRPAIAVRLSDKFSMRAHLGFLGYRDHGDGDREYGLTLDAEALAFGFHYSF
jgi:hypothetical protein